MEGSLVAYKVFTNGSTLQASELNENLMQQSTAVFSNAAARTAAITSPVEGQLTYLEDVDRYEHWTGAAWVSPFGMTLLNTTSFSAATNVSFDNVFSSSYTNYKIITRITSSSVDGPAINCRGRSSGVDYSSSNYRSGYTFYGVTNGTAFTAQVNQTETLFRLGYSSNSMGGGFETLILHPFLAQRTAVRGNGTGSLAFDNSTLINDTNVFDGFSVYPSSGNITGTIRVYGLRG
jgi:hypothetical protein